MNRFEFLGRIANVPKINSLQNGSIVYKTSIAVDRKYKKENEKNVDFFTITAFGKTAEFMQKYMNIKGIRILVEGRIQNKNWEDEQGQKHYTIDFIAEEVYFAGSKKEGNTTQSTTAEVQNNEFEELKSDDDLLF